MVLIVISFLLAALFALSELSKREQYRGLLLVTPSGPAEPGLTPEKLDLFSEEEFLLTYELRQPAEAQAVQSKHPVTIVGTNSRYADVLGYIPLDGGFFTQTAQNEKSRHAVLNEAAACQLFGSIRISGNTIRLNDQTWLITGVIRDQEPENANIYIPASVLGGQADTLMVLMDDGIFTQAYVKSALKSIGIHEGGYDFINLSKSASAFGERFSVAWEFTLLSVMLTVVLGLFGWLRLNLSCYRLRMRELYLRELFLAYHTDFLKTAGGCLLLAAGIWGMLMLSLQILETCLGWQELAPITGTLLAEEFGQKLKWLQYYQWVDLALFWTCIGLVVLCLIGALLSRKRERLKATTVQSDLSV